MSRFPDRAIPQLPATYLAIPPNLPRFWLKHLRKGCSPPSKGFCPSLGQSCWTPTDEVYLPVILQIWPRPGQSSPDMHPTATVSNQRGAESRGCVRCPCFPLHLVIHAAPQYP